MTRALLATLFAVTLPLSALAQSVAERFNDYPTAARADYVFGCMAANGQSREMLERCACSIDEIASILPYETYLEAETVLSMRRVGGERMAVFQSAAVAEDLVAALRRAQAEAEIICF
jgi:lysyl-tRNA synthetase class II